MFFMEVVRISQEVRKDNFLRLSAVLGMIAPITFVATVIILGAIRPGYSHISQEISQLGEIGSSNAIIQDVNFIILGLLILFLAVGLHRGIGDGRGSRVGPAFLVGFAILAGIGNGVFPCAPGCEFVTFSGIMHNLTGLTGFIGFIAAALILPRRFGSDGSWQGLGTYSRLSGVLALGFLVIWIMSMNALPGFSGLFQRVMVGVLLLWIEVMSIRLFQSSKPPMNSKSILLE